MLSSASSWLRELARAAGFGVEHPTLRARLDGRCNNFDFIRLAAAVLVILDHCCLLHRPRATATYVEPFRMLTGHDTSGAMAVRVFFIISGLLVARSFLSDPRPGPYLRKRCLRILPGLVACVLLTVLVMGPLMTKLPLREYFANAETWGYLRNALLWPNLAFYLPGVFAENPSDVVNGSIWSLPLEFMMYIAVLGLGVIGLLRRKYVMLALVVGAFLFQTFVPHEPIQRIRGGFWLVLLVDNSYFFFAGTLMLLFKDVVRLDGRIALAALVATILSFHTRLAFPVYALALPYLIMYAAFVRVPGLDGAARYGDFSYGVYLYGFLIQQVLMSLAPGVSFATFFFASAAGALVAGALSWHLIEKRFLRKKPATSDHHAREGCAVEEPGPPMGDVVGAA